MKIGFDAKRYYHNHTGLGNYSRTIVSGLQRMFPDNEYVLYDEKSFSRTFKLGRKAAADGCDIFHGLSNELPFDTSPLYGGLGGAPRFLVTIHDVAWITFPEMYHWADRHIYNWKYGSSCKRADKVIAISESTKRDVMRFYGVAEDKIEVIYQPVQEQFYAPIPDEQCDKLIAEHFGPEGLPPYILYVGSINSRKNLLSILKALVLIPKENRPLLLIVGNGREYRKECEAYIAQNNLEPYTRIETNIFDSHLLQALYKRAMVMVYPSFYEGFGLPVVEAALQKTPVITTTVSSLPEAAGPDACLIDPHAQDAVEQLAHAIAILTSNTTKARDIGMKMEEYARRMFTPEVLTRQMMDLYHSIL